MSRRETYDHADELHPVHPRLDQIRKGLLSRFLIFVILLILRFRAYMLSLIHVIYGRDRGKTYVEEWVLEVRDFVAEIELENEYEPDVS